MSMFDQAWFEERYRSAPALWSEQPNPQLVAEITDLRPGTALDVGCGEGADAIWLAERGWRVTGVDFSTTALERAAQHAAARGGEVAGRIDWRHADLLQWTPPEAAFDLVSAQYMHLPPEPRAALFTQLGAAVAPGGSLLIVGHDFSDHAAGAHRPDMPEMFFTAQDVAASLARGEWEVLVTEARPRPAKVHEGQKITVHDAVLHARRMAGLDDPRLWVHGHSGA
jgi:SAM-dependent methyltransferase